MRGALLLGAIVCRGHGRSDVYAWGFYVGTRGLAVGIHRRLRLCWRILPRRRRLLHGDMARTAGVVGVVVVVD
jgi:hypothetical protein